MWRRRNDKESIAGFRARSYLRQLELQAYSSLVSALLVQGELTDSRKLTLQTLCSQLHISEERHKAEIRRALCDTDLKKAAEMHIVAAAVASQEITAEDVARHSMPRRPPPGHRALFVTKPHERLSVEDLLMGTEPEQATAAASVKLNTREVMARAVQALYDASSHPADSSDSAATTMTSSSGNVHLSVTSCASSSSSSSSSPSSSAQAPASAPGIAITSTAARQLCSLAERLAATQEAQPAAMRALRGEPAAPPAAPVASHGEASAAATTAAATPRLAPLSSAAVVAALAAAAESPEKKAPRKKAVRRGQARAGAAGDDKPGKGTLPSPVKVPGMPRRPRVPGDGRPKKLGRRPKRTLGDGAMMPPPPSLPADAKPPFLAALTGLPDMAMLPPLTAPGVGGGGGGGVTENTGTLDLLAGMALERNLVAVGGAIGGEGRTSISKTTTSVQVAASGLAGLGDVLPPVPAPLPPRFHPVAAAGPPAQAVAATALNLPLAVPAGGAPAAGGGGAGGGCTATTQVLSPSLASALPSSAWLTNAISAVVSPPAATTLLPAGAGTTAIHAAAAVGAGRPGGGGGATTVVSATLPACTATTAVQGRVVRSSSPTPQLGTATAALHSLAAGGAVSSSSPVTINSSGLPPLFLPPQQQQQQQQQFHVSTTGAVQGDGTHAVPHRSSFSSVTHQSQSLASLAPTTLRTGGLGSGGAALGVATASTAASTSASDATAVSVRTGSMHVSSATLSVTTTTTTTCSSSGTAYVTDAFRPSPRCALGATVDGAVVDVYHAQLSNASQPAYAEASHPEHSSAIPSAADAPRMDMAPGTATVPTLPVAATAVEQAPNGQSLLPAAADSLLLADAYPDYAVANGDVDTAVEAAESYKQVSSLVAELSGSSDEVAAILQKVESRFVAESATSATSTPPRGPSLLDGIALPDDNQLADFIRMCQASDPNAKIEAVSPGDLASVLSAVVSPNTTAAVAVGNATPSGGAVASSLEQMVSEAAAIVGSDDGIARVSSALSAAMDVLPDDIDGFADSDAAAAAAAAAATLAAVLSGSGSPSPSALTDSTRLSSAGDDTVLIGESCVAGAGHGNNNGDGELLTEIVSSANGLLADDDDDDGGGIADESCAGELRDGGVVLATEDGDVRNDRAPLPSNLAGLRASDAAAAAASAASPAAAPSPAAAASPGSDAPDAMVAAAANPEADATEQNDAAAVGVVNSSSASDDVTEPASSSSNSVTAVSSAAVEDVAGSAASAGGNSVSPSPTLPATGRRKRHSSSEEDSWIRTALGLMQRVNRFRGSNRPKSQFNASAWFLQPVNPKSAPGYLNVIKQPMDFGTIKKKLEQGAYATPMQWLSDMYLVRSNCHLYNSAEHKAVTDCGEVFAFFQVEYDKLKDRWENVADRQPAKRARRDPAANTEQ